LPSRAIHAPLTTARLAMIDRDPGITGELIRDR
jgi:hypothetical protein